MVTYCRSGDFDWDVFAEEKVTTDYRAISNEDLWQYFKDRPVIPAHFYGVACMLKERPNTCNQLLNGLDLMVKMIEQKG